MASTTSPVAPLRLSWRISQTKKAIKGSTNMAQNINEGTDMALMIK
jgi:hypothetical protein